MGGVSVCSGEFSVSPWLHIMHPHGELCNRVVFCEWFYLKLACVMFRHVLHHNGSILIYNPSFIQWDTVEIFLYGGEALVEGLGTGWSATSNCALHHIKKRTDSQRISLLRSQTHVILKWPYFFTIQTWDVQTGPVNGHNCASRWSDIQMC